MKKNRERDEVKAQEDSDPSSDSENKGTKKIALRFPKEFLLSLKRTVLHAQRHDQSLTLTSVMVRGAALVKQELEKKYGQAPNSGEVKLRTGRRLQA